MAREKILLLEKSCHQSYRIILDLHRSNAFSWPIVVIVYIQEYIYLISYTTVYHCPYSRLCVCPVLLSRLCCIPTLIYYTLLLSLSELLTALPLTVITLKSLQCHLFWCC